MSRLLTTFALGYHGCENEVADRIIAHNEEFTLSTNQNDWLGDGVYFWEANPYKALDWAKEKKFERPAVVGAIIDLGNCLDLLNQNDQDEVSRSFDDLKKSFEALGESNPLPENNIKTGNHVLDCMVINNLHQDNIFQQIPPYDTVRGMFQEVSARALYHTSAIFRGSHIQISVRNAKASIKGDFRPPELNK